MPTYEYHCQECGSTSEAFQKISDAPLTVCPQCGKSSLKRGPGGGFGLSFQGSGFYITDYQKGNSSGKSGCCPCGKEKTSCSS